MPKFTLQLHDQEAEIEVTRQGDVLRIQRAAEAAEIHLLHQDGPTFVAEWVHPNGARQRLRVAGHTQADRRQLWVNGRTFAYERVRRRAGAGPVDASLAASIPALVSQILVEVGDAVRTGDKLILLESMKMVIPIQAPYDGTVTAVHCTPGASVEAGVQLIELEQHAEQSSG